MRYELKIQLPESYYEYVIKRLYSSNYMIREVYNERKINNIYFDTLNYTDYLSNYHGDADRKKYRIRWYGDLKGLVVGPVLELKYKEGLIGGKELLTLPEFIFNSVFSYHKYTIRLKEQLTKESNKYDWMVGELLQRNPVMVNCYSRRYFSTGDNKYRFTLDNDMWFYNYKSALYGQQKAFGTHDPHLILEVKFESEDLPGATKLVNDLGYRVYKNSKYVNGINAVMFNSSLKSI